LSTKKAVIFTDGAAEPNPGPAAIGAALKDEQGRILSVISQSISKATNNQAEYRAIITALEMALELNVSHVQVRSDSQLVVRQINGQYRVKDASLKPLYLQVKQLQSQFEGFTISYIPGELNTEAHNLANAALRPAP
jgi:ribonuclease HI